VKADIVVGMQWGDEGKGKVVDYLASLYSAVVRFNGGPNAGHTVIANNTSFTFHHIPSGALRGAKLFISPGMLVNPEILNEEISSLKQLVSSFYLKIDSRTSLITPADVVLDKKIEELKGASSIGTTLRGIGPAYSSKALRISPRVVDVLNRSFDSYIYKKLYSIEFDSEQWLKNAKKSLEDYASDVREELLEILNNQGNVLFESAQGTLLDPIYGTYPYVTSSNTTASYAFVSSGIPYKYSGKVIGVLKAYTTRVGKGPMPTEMSEDLAMAIRESGKEYGATTGRARRIGWLDIPALRYATEINGTDEIFITKLDVLSGIRELKVAVSYNIDGKEVERFSPLENLENTKPVYQSLDPIPKLDASNISYIIKNGWSVAPVQMRKYVSFIEESLRTKISYVSLGAERGMTVKVE
jgi:Adenylosuccinate synthase